MYRSAQRIRRRQRAILMSRDSFSARCHRRTNRTGLYWNCQTVQISIRMLVGARNKIVKENERNRKQTVQLKEGKAEREKKMSCFFFLRNLFLLPGYGWHWCQQHPESLGRKSKNKNKIMIINGKRHLSRNDIERWTKRKDITPKTRSEQRERVAAKSKLELYYFNMKSTVEEEKVKEKILEADRNHIIKKRNEIIK